MKGFRISAFAVCLLAVAGSAFGQSASALRVMFQSGHVQPVSVVAFLPDGRALWSADEKQHRLWDLETGRILKVAQIPNGMLSPDGRFSLRVVSEAIELWDMESGKRRSLLEWKTDNICCAQFSADGGRVLAAGGDHSVRLWDAASGRLLQTFQGHTEEVRSVALSQDGALALSADGAGAAKLWDTKTGRLVSSFAVPAGAASLGFSADGKRVVASGNGYSVWDVETGQAILARQTDGGGRAVFSPDGQFVAIHGADNLQVQRIEGGAQALTLAPAEKVTSVAFSPDSRWLASGNEDGSVSLWDAQTGALSKTFGKGWGFVRQGRHPLEFSPDGRRLVVSGAGKLEFWDLAGGGLRQAVDGGEALPSTSAFTRDGRLLLVGSDQGSALKDAFLSIFGKKVDDEGKGPRLWDAENGALLKTFDGFVLSVAIAPDGSKMLVGSGLWDKGGGKQLLSLEAPGAVSAAFTPDGRQILTSADSLQLWDAVTGQLVRTFEGSSKAGLVAVSPDGRFALTGGAQDDLTARLWEVGTGKLVRTFEGLRREAFKLSFTPDGRQALVGVKEGALRRWDIETGKFAGECGYFFNATLAPDGERFAATVWDGAVEVRSVRDGKLLATLVYGESGEWLALTPAGFFEASPEGAALVHAVRGRDVIASDELRKSLRRPDLVVEALAGDPKGRYEKATAELDLSLFLRKQKGEGDGSSQGARR